MSAVPHPLQSLVGRDRECARARTLLERARWVTLVGPGGVGKTRLAVEVARGCGAVFVDLAPVRAVDQVLPAIARALGLREGGARPLAGTLRAHLAERSELLLLDNAEHVLDAADDVVDLLARCPGVRLLCTSRAPWRVPGEQVVSVEPLALPPSDVGPDDVAVWPSVALFLERAAEADPGLVLTADDVTTVVRLCTALDGLPLALELAAAQLRVRDLATVLDGVAAGVGLVGLPRRGVPVRHRTLAAAVHWSVDLLDDRSARVFRRLAVFAGRFDAAAAAEVCADPETDVATALATLVDHSLVAVVRDPAGSGHRLLDTVREQAWVLLEEHDEVDLQRRRHLAWVARLAELPRAPTKPLDAVPLIDRVEAVLDDVRAALTTHSPDDHTTALAVAAGLYRLWDSRGYLTEGRRHLERLLPSMEADPGPEPVIVASGWDALGMLALWQDDHETARQALTRSAQLFAACGDDGAWAWSSASLVMSFCMRGDHQGVEPLAERAVDVAKACGDTVACSRALCALALVRRAQGATASSVALMEEGLDLHAEMPWVRGKFSYFLGWFAVLDGELDLAGELLSIASAEFERIGDRRSLPDALDALGCLAELRGEGMHAVRAFDRSRALRERAGSRRHPYLAERADPAERRARAGTAGPTVTARELEVARLVAQGHTNRQIGRRLSISERTAERHVENLRAKLGVGTRAQIAAWVARTTVPTSPR